MIRTHIFKYVTKIQTHLNNAYFFSLFQFCVNIMVSKAILVAWSAKKTQMHKGILGTGLNGDIFCCRFKNNHKISYCFEAFSLGYVGYPSKF